jgi:signal transduction histidine kinase/CheY-like chemotaxis protein
MEIPSAVDSEFLLASFTVSGERVSFNAAWEAVFGNGKTAWERLSLGDDDLACQNVREAATGSPVTHQLFLIHVPIREEPLPVLLHFMPVFLPDAAGHPRVVAVQVTGDVLVEPSTWTASQTLRHRMETLGRMTMGIAHDFNNLLGGILGHLELFRHGAVEAPPTFAEHLYAIEQAALDGALLVRKIQRYVRQEQEAAFEPTDLAVLLQDCQVLTRPYWFNEPRRQGITITFTLDLEEVPPITGTAAALRDVFVNLILNAVQAMPQGGAITITLRHVPVQGVIVRFQDTGTGMSEAVMARIFEPLFTTKGERGNGMGLAVAYGTVQEHGGSIHVASRLGEGTTFTLIFPVGNFGDQPRPETLRQPPYLLGSPEVVPPVAPLETAAPALVARLLVVDDDPRVRTILARLLRLLGHDVVETASGPEALARLPEAPFDLVFTDLGMPDMNGRQLAEAIRAQRADLPIVLLTGDTEVGQPDRVINAILSKPFKLIDLQNTLAYLLNPTP